MREWSELKGVLDFEELKFSSSFIKYVPHYSKSLEHQILVVGILKYMITSSHLGVSVPGLEVL